MFIFLFISVCFLAYTNGANDNFKGVATLFGSKTINYKQAIIFATLTTFAGSMASVFFAEALLENFSGKGLVPPSITDSPIFLISVALGAGLTVLLGTLTGFPLSTTHSLLGGLLGAGFIAIGINLNFNKLGTTFFLPLLLSPVIAMVLSGSCYFLSKSFKRKIGVSIDGNKKVEKMAIPIYKMINQKKMEIAIKNNVEKINTNSINSIKKQKLLDFAHFISAGLLSFSRGLNDTPKIIALLLVAKSLQIKWSMLIIAIMIALGGLINAKRVGTTISKKVTLLNPEQGFIANFISSILIIFATRLGMPVSTTHVTVGAIFGIGIINKKSNIKMIKKIILIWIITLPVSAIFSGILYSILNIL